MVFVIDKHKNPIMPCTEKRARLLLKRRRAVIHKMIPFTIRIKDLLVKECGIQNLRVKIDPGSKQTGLALLNNKKKKANVLYLAEIHHRTDIKKKILYRKNVRKSRKYRKTPYREPRFLNRKNRSGCISPSIKARIDQIKNVLLSLSSIVPIKFISVEFVKFKIKKHTNKIFKTKEDLIRKYGKSCTYCNKKDINLEIDHIIPRSRGGSNRLDNLTLACRKCNIHKGNKTAKEFGYANVHDNLQKSLVDESFMNISRKYLNTVLNKFVSFIDYADGRRTRIQRIDRRFPKTHYFDALCSGRCTAKQFILKTSYVNIWKAQGRGSRKMSNINKYGFPIGCKDRKKSYFGFSTGDIVRANILKGKYSGKYTGRVLIRKTGQFDIKNSSGNRIVQGVSYKNMIQLQRNNGWFLYKTYISK